MSIEFYPAILEKEPDSDFCVFFPDLDGVVAAGNSASEALRNAEGALQFYIDELLQRGKALPRPSEPDDIADDPEVNRISISLIRCRLPGQARRINLTLDEHLLAEIDAAAADRGDSRSGFIAEATRRMIRSKYTNG